MTFYEKYNYYRSQTALKDLERDTTCPVRWYAKWLLKDKSFDDPSQTSVPKTYGHLFEFLAIGGNAKDDFNIDLVPKNKDGTKKADVVRIEEQAATCKSMLFDPSSPRFLGIDVLEVQYRVVIEETRDAIVLDVLGKEGKDLVMLDLKLTADVNNTWGDFGWGNPGNMDLFQQAYYERVFNRKMEMLGLDARIGKNLLLVMDYSPLKGKKLIEVTVTERGFAQVDDRVAKFEDTITQYEKHGWPFLPSPKECADCPLKCPERFTESPLVFSEITL